MVFGPAKTWQGNNSVNDFDICCFQKTDNYVIQYNHLIVFLKKTELFFALYRVNFCCPHMCNAALQRRMAECSVCYSCHCKLIPSRYKKLKNESFTTAIVRRKRKKHSSGKLYSSLGDRVIEMQNNIAVLETSFFVGACLQIILISSRSDNLKLPYFTVKLLKNKFVNDI